MFRALLLIGVSLFAFAPVAAQEIDSGSHQESTGSTRSKGSYSIVEEGNRVKIRLRFSVRKSGISGTGRGVMGFALLDADGDTIFEESKGFSVGADLSGSRTREYEKTFTMIGRRARKFLEDGGVVAFTVQTEKDTIGIPQNMDEWKDAINDFAPVWDSLEVGDETEKNNWFFKRLIH